MPSLLNVLLFRTQSHRECVVDPGCKRNNQNNGLPECDSFTHPLSAPMPPKLFYYTTLSLMNGQHVPPTLWLDTVTRTVCTMIYIELTGRTGSLCTLCTASFTLLSTLNNTMWGIRSSTYEHIGTVSFSLSRFVYQV